MATCSCGGCGCGVCLPASGIFLSECPDPGTIAAGFHLQVMDSKFCDRRLTNAVGLLQSVQTGGSYQLTFTNLPQIELTDFNATANTAFGQPIVMGSDNKWRALVPPNSSGLFLQTNGAGDLIFGSAPAATVPDPLSISDLNVSNDTTLNNAEITGTLELPNAAAGTVVALLGLNAADQVVTQALAQGVGVSMFFESPSSPNAATPNSGKVTGEYLVIGNRLYDSGASLINVTTSESVTVQVAGKYLLFWTAQGRSGGAAAPTGGVWLEINGVIVNYGNGRTSVTGSAGSTAQMWQFAGIEARNLSANDVIKLQLSETASTWATYEVRLIAVKFSDP